jgi:hypothetical protein
MKTFLRTFAIFGLAFFLFAAGAAFKPDKVIFVHKNKCEDGFCLKYQDAAFIEQGLDDIDHYLNKIESGDTTYKWLDRIEERVNIIKSIINQ